MPIENTSGRGQASHFRMYKANIGLSSLHILNYTNNNAGKGGYFLMGLDGYYIDFFSIIFDLICFTNKSKWLWVKIINHKIGVADAWRRCKLLKVRGIIVKVRL
jgi:hypothetical protein